MKRISGMPLPHERGAIGEGVEPDKSGGGCPEMINVMHTADGSGLISVPGHHRTSTRRLMDPDEVNTESLFHRVVLFPGEWVRDSSYIGIAVIDETNGAPVKIGAFKPLVPRQIPSPSGVASEYTGSLYAAFAAQTIGYIRRHGGVDEVYMVEFENKVYIGSQYDEAYVFDGHEFRLRGLRPPYVAPTYHRYDIWNPSVEVEATKETFFTGAESGSGPAPSTWVRGSGRSDVTIDHNQSSQTADGLKNNVAISFPYTERDTLGAVAYIDLGATGITIDTTDPVFSVNWFQLLGQHPGYNVDISLVLDTTQNFSSVAADQVTLRGKSAAWKKIATTGNGNLAEEFEMIDGSEHIDGSFTAKSVGIILNDIIPNSAFSTREKVYRDEEETYIIPAHYDINGSGQSTYVPESTATRTIQVFDYWAYTYYPIIFKLNDFSTVDTETTQVGELEAYQSKFAFSLVNRAGIESNISPSSDFVDFSPGDKFYLNLTGQSDLIESGYNNNSVFQPDQVKSVRVYVNREDWGTKVVAGSGREAPDWRMISEQALADQNEQGYVMFEYAEIVTFDDIFENAQIPNDNHFTPPATAMCIADGQRLIQAGESTYSVGQVSIAAGSHELRMQACFSGASAENGERTNAYFSRLDLAYANWDLDGSNIALSVNATQYWEYGYRVGDEFGVPSGTPTVWFWFESLETGVFGPHFENNAVQLRDEQERYSIKKALPMEISTDWAADDPSLEVFDVWDINLEKDWQTSGDTGSLPARPDPRPRGYVAWPLIPQWGLTPFAYDSDADGIVDKLTASKWPYSTAVSYPTYGYAQKATGIESETFLIHTGHKDDTGTTHDYYYQLPTTASGNCRMKVWLIAASWANPDADPLGGMTEEEVQATMGVTISIGGKSTTQITGIHGAVSATVNHTFGVGEVGEGADYVEYQGDLGADLVALEGSYPTRVEEYNLFIQDSTEPLKVSFDNPAVGESGIYVYVQVYGVNTAEYGLQNYTIGQTTAHDILKKTAYDRLYIERGDNAPHESGNDSAGYFIGHGRNRLWWSIKDNVYGTYAEAVGLGSFTDLEMPGDLIKALQRVDAYILVYGSKHNVRVAQNHGVKDDSIGAVFQRPVRFDNVAGCISKQSLVPLEGGSTFHLSAQGDIVQTGVGDTAVHPSSKMVREWLRNRFKFPANALSSAVGFYVKQLNSIVWMIPDRVESEVSGADFRARFMKRDYMDESITGARTSADYSADFDMIVGDVDHVSDTITSASPPESIPIWAHRIQEDGNKARSVRPVTKFDGLKTMGFIFNLEQGNIYPLKGLDIIHTVEIAASYSPQGTDRGTLFGADSRGYLYRLHTSTSKSWGCPVSRSAFEVATKTGNKITLVTPTTVPTDYLEGLYVSVRNAGEDDMSNERAPGGGADDQFLEIQRNADGVAANVITLDDAQTIEVGDSIYLAPMLCGVMFQEQRTRYQMVLEAFSANIHDETIDFQPAYSGSATNMHETNGQPIAASVITADDTRNVLTLDETMKSTTRVYFKSNDLDIGRGQIFFPRVSSKALALSLHWTPGLSGKFIIADPKIDLLVDEREPGR